GTPVDSIDLAEDRGRFGAVLREIGIRHPAYGVAGTGEEAAAVARTVGFPLLVRPSYVLGGRAMEICYSEDDLVAYVERLSSNGGSEVREEMYPLLLDRFLENAIEIDVDALADGEDVFVAGIMQHVEEAGVHSGYAVWVLLALSLGDKMREEVG